MKETEAEKFYFPDDLPLFSPGQIIRHRRYGYRGVVVDFDMRCRASDDWYRANRTRPKREQPWYHVMVDGSTSITYAAQDSLVADDKARPVHHPLVHQFFEGISRGRYQRNDEIWPGWD
jgi:heat shock protein HspQ